MTRARREAELGHPTLRELFELSGTPPGATRTAVGRTDRVACECVVAPEIPLLLGSF